jgi:hypothetical protein
VEALGACYKQLNSSVGEFGTATLQADTTSIEGSSTNDAIYTAAVAHLAALDLQRDHLAETIKNELDAAEFQGQNIADARAQTQACQSIISQAQALTS